MPVNCVDNFYCTVAQYRVINAICELSIVYQQALRLNDSYLCYLLTGCKQPAKLINSCGINCQNVMKTMFKDQ